MNLTRLQKISLAVFIGSCIPAYLVADWRHNVQLARIAHDLEQEQALHLSAEKLINNCQQNELHTTAGYGPHHQICANGVDTHERTAQAIDALTQEKDSLPWRKFRHFIWAVISFNLIGFVLYKGHQLLRIEKLE